MTFSLWLKIGIKFLSVIIPILTPEFRKILEEQIKSLYEKAKVTDNIADDLVIKLIADLLNIKLDSE